MAALVRKTEHWEISEVIIRRNKAQNGAVLKSQQIYIAVTNRNGDDQKQEFTKKSLTRFDDKWLLIYWMSNTYYLSRLKVMVLHLWVR
jgi:hypothetical protein